MTTMDDPPRLDERQRATMDSASVFERLSAEVGPDQPVAPGAAPTLRDGVATALHLFTDVVLQVIDGLPLPEAAPAGDAETDEGPVTVRARPGRTATTSLWIHNMTADPVPRVTLRLTRWTSHDGAEVTADAATFLPACLDIAAQASEQVTLTVTVPGTARPGTYFCHVLATGLPEAALTVRLVVER